ncbi:MAG: CDP-alcohol phosphatidyltransferase family protein, partial [Terracidiphilus sp.]
ILNWFGDSMDGTLARVRNQQRPRYGFYVDHMVDIFGATALMCGLGFSGFVHWQVAMAMLLAFLLLSAESYLATYTLSCFQMSQGIFGPTEIRILLIMGNLALLRSPYATVMGHRLLLFDVGGVIAAIAMFAMAVAVAARHTGQLYRQEPLP